MIDRLIGDVSSEPRQAKVVTTGSRQTATSRDVKAGCFVCGGSEALWNGPQAQGTAARHHDATGHATWADVYLSVRYGEE